MLRKTCCNCLCILLWYKRCRYFTEVQSCLLLLVLHKIKKDMQENPEAKVFRTFGGMTSLTPNSKLWKFLTSWKLIKTPYNFVQGSWSIKLTKVYHKNRSEAFWPQVLFKKSVLLSVKYPGMEIKRIHGYYLCLICQVAIWGAN